MTKRRILSFCLALAMLLGLLPVAAFAAPTEINNTTINITIDNVPIYQDDINESVNITMTGQWVDKISFKEFGSSSTGKGTWATAVKRYNEEWAKYGSFDEETDYALVFYLYARDGYCFPKWEDWGSKIKFNVSNAEDPSLVPYKVEAYNGYTSVASPSNDWVQVALWFHSRAYVGSWENAVYAPWSSRIISIMDMYANGFAPGVAVQDLSVTKTSSGQPYYNPSNMGSDGKQKLEIWQGSTRLAPTDKLQANVDYKLRFCIRLIDAAYYCFHPEASVFVNPPVDTDAIKYKENSSYEYVFEAPFRLESSTLNQGRYTVDLRSGLTEVYKDADDSAKEAALNNTLEKLREEYALGSGELDLDKDGVWDVKPSTVDGKLCWNPNPGSKVHGDFVYSLSSEQIKAFETNYSEYYDSLRISFVGQDLGTALIDLSDGPYLFPAEDEGFAVFALAYLISVFTGKDVLPFDVDEDGNDDFALGPVDGSAYFYVLETANVEGEQLWKPNTQSQIDSTVAGGGSVYSAYNVIFPTKGKDLGDKLFSVTAAGAPVNDPMAEAELNLMASQGVIKLTGDYFDLDKDGKNDVEFYDKDSVRNMRVLDTTNLLDQSYTVTLPAAKQEEYRQAGTDFYSTITFKLSSSSAPGGGGFDPTGKTNPFVDVSESNYYYTPVLWAYYSSPQITVGVDDTHFGPDKTVTRGQCVTFLWRAMGQPEPTATKNPFVDVSESVYWYKAILWAVEKGITVGTDATHFSPARTLSTHHIVTFLYRTLNPGMGGPNGGWDGEAEAWARANDPKGTNLPFGVNIAIADSTPCPRADVVTFLYEALT